MRRFKLLFILCSFFMLSHSLPSPSFAEPYKRIISLAPNITEILFAMGLGYRIAGVTNFCDYPEEAKKKTKVGGMSNPSLEAVISLKPDIVLMTTDGNFKEFQDRLQSLKIKTYVFKARRLSELPQGIRDMGSMLGVGDRADKLSKEIETSINTFKMAPVSRHPAPGKGAHATSGSLTKKVLFIIWPEPLIVAGPRTAIDDAITLLGAVNIASKTKVSYPKYSIEEIIRQSPDIILIGKGHADGTNLSAGILQKIASVPAVRNQKVFFLGDNLYRLGPRIPKGIEEMAACLN